MLFYYDHELSLFENQMIHLVETGGVGIYPFKNVVEAIFQNIQETVRTHQNEFSQEQNEEWGEGILQYRYFRFSVPKYLTNQITFSQDLDIIVNAFEVLTYNGEKSQISGGGFTDMEDEYIQLQTDKQGITRFSKSKIIINIYIKNFECHARTVNKLLYHEFNHLWQAFNILHNTGNPEKLIMPKNNSQWTDTMVQQGRESINKNVRMFCNMVYDLLPDEIDQKVASVYGELKGMQSRHFNCDCREVEQYQVYYQIKTKDLPYLNSLEDADWMGFAKYYWDKSKDVQVLRNKVNKWVQYQLNTLFHKMGKTASLYYEDINENYMVAHQSDPFPMPQKYNDTNENYIEMIKEMELIYEFKHLTYASKSNWEIEAWRWMFPHGKY